MRSPRSQIGDLYLSAAGWNPFLKGPWQFAPHEDPMSSPARSVVSPKQLLSTLRRHFFVWAAPTVVLTVLAIGYAVVRPTSGAPRKRSWCATKPRAAARRGKVDSTRAKR